jgi:hypothetical protein
MSKFIKNSIQFSADCVQDNGLCKVDLDNFLFIDDGKELAAIDRLERECGKVVVIPDSSNKGQAFLYYTSCERMSDAVNQIFQDHLEAPASVSRLDAEMTLGELLRRSVTMSYDDCRAKVKGFSF